MFKSVQQPPIRHARHFILAASRLLVLLSMIHASGLGLNATQAYAWSTMLYSYSHDYGFQKGWQRTFDGQHPCKICCCVQKMRDTEPGSLDGLTCLNLDEVRLPIPRVDCQPILPPLRPDAAKNAARSIAYRFSLALWSSSPCPPPPRNV